MIPGAILLSELTAAGLALAAEGDRLVVTPATRLTDATRQAIRAHKVELVVALMLARLRDVYGERAAIIEYDGKVSRPEAERVAFETVIALWLNDVSNAAPLAGAGQCAACAGPLGDDAVPVLRPGGGHTELHRRCVMAWLKRRRAEAAAALEAVGIPWPAGWTP